MSQSTAGKKIEYSTASRIFWSLIFSVILSISLLAGWLADKKFIQTTAKSQEKSAQVPMQPPTVPVETFSKNAMVWKTVAQQMQQIEDKTLQVLANALDKLPDLAPLPRPTAVATTPPAPVKTVPSTPIAWKLLSEQLVVTEQQQVMMLHSFLAKAEK